MPPRPLCPQDWVYSQATDTESEVALPVAVDGGAVPPPTCVPSHPRGRKLLADFAPLLAAAHSGALDGLNLRLPNGYQYQVGFYTRAVSEGIRTGEGLRSPYLDGWLENLRRLQDWWSARAEAKSPQSVPAQS